LRRKIIAINVSKNISGAEKSLHDFLIRGTKHFKFLLVTGNTKFYIGITQLQLFVSFQRFKVLPWLKNFREILNFIIKTKPEVIYFNTEKSFIMLFPIVFFSFKRKIIWHIRDNIRNKIVAKVLAFFSYKIICNSKFILNQLENSKKGVIIHNGVDTDLFKPLNHLFEKEKIVACISQLTPWKKIEDFIEIARITSSQSKDVKFLIVGDILNPKDIRYKEYLEKLVVSYNLESKIEFTGFIDNIPEFLQQIDILCHTALNEPFGRVIIEAMSCEKPVIAYNSGGIKEILTDNTGILVPENNIEVFAMELEELLNDELRKEKIGKGARIRVRENFGIEKHITQMEEIFT